MCADLRIEGDSIKSSNIDSLNKIALYYDSKKAQRTLSHFLRDLKTWN